MENFQQYRKLDHQSHVLTTLHRQIESLTPLRPSYTNLLEYHDRISLDLASLIDQHDFEIQSLKTNLHNLVTIGNRTQAERNDLVLDVNGAKNQLAKLVLDVRNQAQRYEALGQKLELERSRTEQNQSYRAQLTTINQTLQTHISTTQNHLEQLTAQQSLIQEDHSQVNAQIQSQQSLKTTLLQSNENFKTSIARINVKNDDMIDGNRKLSEEIRGREELCQEAGRRNRELKEEMIEKRARYEKLRNQIQFKLTVLESENAASRQLAVHEAKLEQMIADSQHEKSLVCQQNQGLQQDITQLFTLKQQNLTFLHNSQTHLSQLHQTNELLMSRMQQFCIEDQEVQNVLLRKMAALEFFAKKLARKYEDEKSAKIDDILVGSALFKERVGNFDGVQQRNDYQKLGRVEVKKGDSKKETSSSEVKPWVGVRRNQTNNSQVKENNCVC